MGGYSSFPSRAGLLPINTPLQASLGWWDSHQAAQFVSKAEGFAGGLQGMEDVSGLNC